LTDEFFERASEYRGEVLVRRGRPASAVHKAPVTLRLDAETLARWRTSGKGWQTRAAARLAEKAPR
ncbi:MAG: BrnA antitoxin family protein, partial [Rubrivivax sp.]